MIIQEGRTLYLQKQKEMLMAVQKSKDKQKQLDVQSEEEQMKPILSPVKYENYDWEGEDLIITEEEVEDDENINR